MHCQAGFYSTIFGSTTLTDGCSNCPVGTFALAGSNVCSNTSCAAGYFASTSATGNTTATDGCSKCAAGSWSLIGDNICSSAACPSGYFTTYIGASSAIESCHSCLIGTYSSFADDTFCSLMECPPG